MQPLKTNRENDFYSRADGRLSEFGTNEEPFFWLSVSCQYEELGATFQTVKSIWPNTKKVLLFSTNYKVGTKSFTVIAFKWRCRSIGSKKTFYSTKSCSSNHSVPGFFFPASFSRPLFLYFRRYNTVDSKQTFNINISDDWIQIADLRYWKWPLFQLSHNHCPLYPLKVFEINKEPLFVSFMFWPDLSVTRWSDCVFNIWPFTAM